MLVLFLKEYFMEQTKFIVFDLDGTLCNTIIGLFNASKDYFKANNLEFNYTLDDIKSFIGNGARKLFQRLLKSDTIDENEYQEYLKYYLQDQYVSRLYPNVRKTLLKLISRGYKLLIYSNKPNNLLQPLVSYKFKGIEFIHIQGQDDNYPCKPDPTLLKIILNKYELNPKYGYYVGDSYVDVLTGKNVNLKTIVLEYGYGDLAKIKETKPDVIIKNFKELLEVIK